jgi:hypothetical protein
MSKLITLNDDDATATITEATFLDVLTLNNTDEETGTCVCTHCDSMSLIADLIPKEG